MLPRIGRGAFADVFDLDGGRVLKAFRDLAPARFPEADATVIPRVAYYAEKTLYERIRDHEDLEVYLPQFFGVIDPRTYSLESEEAYSNGYGFILERIFGEESKLFGVPPEYLSEVEGVVDAIKDRTGVDDPRDGSCFIPGSRARFTVIDIATPSERLGLVDELMARDGQILAGSLSALGIKP